MIRFRTLHVLPLGALLLGAVVSLGVADRPARAEADLDEAVDAVEPPVRHASVPAPEVREPTSDTAVVRAAIERAYADWSAAFVAGDIRQLGAYYTSEASLVSATEETIEGRGKIIEFLAGLRREGLKRPSLKTLEVITVGNIAYEIGTYGLTFEADPGAASDDGAVAERVDTGRYFAVWRAQPDGGWLYHLGVWQSEPEAGADTAMAR